MWEAVRPSYEVPTLQLCFLHQTRYYGTKVGPLCSKRAENRPHGKDTDCWPCHVSGVPLRDIVNAWEGCNIAKTGIYITVYYMCNQWLCMAESRIEG